MSTKLSRRDFLRLSALAAAGVAAAACAKTEVAPTATTQVVVPPVIKEATATPKAAEPTATPKPPTPTPKPVEVKVEPFTVNGVTMNFNRSETVINDQVNFAVFDSFNPFIPNGVEFAAGWWQISNEYLWYVNYASGEVVPWLAEGHEYSSDYKTLTIHTRKGAAWNDGKPFTAHDIAFTMNLVKSDSTLYGPQDVKYWEDVSATDDFTVVFKMTEPRPRQHLIFWCKICTGQQIVPKHIWEKEDPKTFKSNPPVTTGPYMFDKAYPEQKILVWKRNENYWNKDKAFPAPKYVIYRSGPGAEQQLAEIKSNNMDIFGMAFDTYQEKQSEIAHINYVAYVDPCPRGAFFNCAKPHLDKAEFRRALSMLMNRPKWAENIWVPPSKPAIAFWADYRNLDKFINEEANKKWGILEYNPKKALEIITGLGYKQEGGKLLDAKGMQVKFEVTTPAGPGGWEYMMAQDFIEEMKAIGIDATLQNFEQPVMFAGTENGTFEIGFWWMCGTTVDPTELFNDFTCDRVVPIGEPAKRGNEMRLCDPELDAVMAKLMAIDPDAPAAKALYMQAYDLFMRDAPGVPLIQTYYTAYFNTTYWDNMMSNENLYTVPFNWWGQILFVLFNIKPKG